MFPTAYGDTDLAFRVRYMQTGSGHALGMTHRVLLNPFASVDLALTEGEARMEAEEAAAEAVIEAAVAGAEARAEAEGAVVIDAGSWSEKSSKAQRWGQRSGQGHPDLMDFGQSGVTQATQATADSAMTKGKADFYARWSGALECHHSHRGVDGHRDAYSVSTARSNFNQVTNKPVAVFTRIFGWRRDRRLPPLTPRLPLKHLPMML